MVAQLDREYVRLGVGRMMRRLTSYALFEGRPHTTRGQWFNPVVFGLLRGLRALPGQPRVRSPIFITGLGRSGTTVLGLLFSLHDEVGFLNEPKAIWTLIEPRHDVTCDYTTGAAAFRLDPKAISDDTRETAHRLFARYLRLVGAKRVVDKYPELIFRVDYVLSLFPDARIIFITRNGIDACRSIALWSDRKGQADTSGVEDWWGRNGCKWKTLWQEFVLKDTRFEPLRALGPDGLDHSNRAAVEWIVTMEEGIEQIRRHPEQVYRIRYEDLVLDPDRELSPLLDWCHLSRDPAVYRYAASQLFSRPVAAMPAILPALEQPFRETMAALGYGDFLPGGEGLRAGCA